MYQDQMLIYITRGQVEAAAAEESKSTVFYPPHQAVKNEKYGKAKWRIVFNSSSHETKAPSLNEVLEVERNFLHEIFAILLRFSLHPETIFSDIKQAFLQLALDEKDRDLARFFRYRITQDREEQYHTTEEVVDYSFTLLPFGLTCGPFLLSATLNEYADRHKVPFPTAEPHVGSNASMDDYAADAGNDNGAIAIYYELTTMMKLIVFPLAKWASNSE